MKRNNYSIGYTIKVVYYNNRVQEKRVKMDEMGFREEKAGFATPVKEKRDEAYHGRGSHPPTGRRRLLVFLLRGKMGRKVRFWEGC